MEGADSVVGEVMGSRPETLEPARWRFGSADSLGVFVRPWLICGDEAGDDDSRAGGRAC